jgi:uncharacterized membrane protein
MLLRIIKKAEITFLAIKTIAVILMIIAIMLVLMAVAAPTLQTIFGYPAGEKEYALLSNICHQYPTRCIWILDRPMALCTRCLFGYLGLIAGMILIVSSTSFALSRRHVLFGIVLFLIAVIDPVIQLLTNYESSNFVRAITGLLGGFAMTWILFPFQTTRRLP